MSYLTLTRQEIKELIEIRLSYFIGYLIVTSVLFLAYFQVLNYFMPRIVNSLPLLPVLVFIPAAFGYLLYHNIEYLKEIIQKRKRVYRGVLGIKTFSHGYCSFHMDGYCFTVEEEDYHKFTEGDFLEFHISPSTKHLFKVIRIEY